MDDFDQQPQPTAASEPAGAAPSGRQWVGPVVIAALILVPVAILIFSNTEDREVAFGPWSWVGPLWITLAITFAAGAVLTRFLMWFLRTYLRRRRKGRGEA
jgi:uncharacterized integral membrane protein